MADYLLDTNVLLRFSDTASLVHATAVDAVAVLLRPVRALISFSLPSPPGLWPNWSGKWNGRHASEGGGAMRKIDVRLDWGMSRSWSAHWPSR